MSIKDEKVSAGQPRGLGRVQPVSAVGVVVIEAMPRFGRQTPVLENERPNAVERLAIHVTFDQQRGYIATAVGLPIITALSLASLRRRIDARLSKGVIARLQLDGAARQERDARRRGTETGAVGALDARNSGPFSRITGKS